MSDNRTDEEEKTRAEVVGNLARIAGLIVTTTKTPEGVAYSLEDSAGDVLFRFGPDAIFNGNPNDFVQKVLEADNKRRERKESEPVNDLSN